ncbi:hypothetical protein GJQ54_11225 [Oceanospirillaceae bacterium ASx5O]|nr:hypothetical protein GJQ54_11225 [Oceanospirillaceae bacterium ASx5O]
MKLTIKNLMGESISLRDLGQGFIHIIHAGVVIGARASSVRTEPGLIVVELGERQVATFCGITAEAASQIESWLKAVQEEAAVQ